MLNLVLMHLALSVGGGPMAVALLLVSWAAAWLGFETSAPKLRLFLGLMCAGSSFSAAVLIVGSML